MLATRNQAAYAPVLTLSVEVVEVVNGKKLKSIKPDSDGYFCDFPVAVIGSVSRNRTWYDPKSIADQLNTPGEVINMMLTDGTLFGEYGHPKLLTAKPDTIYLRRLTEIHEDRVSHHIRKIRIGAQMDSGGQIIYADIKPFGPYREPLYESFIDPNVNTAFSLRSICVEEVDQAQKIIRRWARRLVTFDAVCTGGFGEASKRYVEANESVQLSLTDFLGYNGISVDEVCAVEMIKDKDLLKLFNTKDLIINKTKYGIVIPNTGGFLNDTGDIQSIFHTINQTRKLRRK